MMNNVVDEAIHYIVMNTMYSAHQCYRVLEIVSKWGEKAPYHMTRKQNDILNKLLYLLGDGEAKWEVS